MKILFLYTELADYTLACLRALKNADPGIQLLVIHYPVNKEAPFLFDFGNIGEFICLADFPKYALFKKCVSEFNPDKVVCSGWINKWYVRFCWIQKNASPCIVAIDNVWGGNWKQHVLKALSLITIRRIFNKIWVPGNPQLTYAGKLGYSNKDTLTGYYCCDTLKFRSLFEKNRERKMLQFPRRFLCVARYIPEKGYNLLWEAFIEWKTSKPNNWELWCAGTGLLFDQRIHHDDIRHLGFIQEKDWEEIVANTGVFVLPSKYEPWGVVVHEFSASGFPLLLSNKVGAASTFLTRKNGLSFDPENKIEFINCFEQFSRMTDEELYLMSVESSRLAEKITPEHWSCTLLEA